MQPSKRAQLAIFFTVFVDLLGFGIVIPILPLYAKDLALHPSAWMTWVNHLLRFKDAPAFWALAAIWIYSVCQFVASPILGKISDRVGRRPVLWISQIGTFLAYLLMAVTGRFELVLLARILEGLTGGNISVANAAMVDSSSPKERSKALGKIGAAFGLGFVLGPAMAALLSGSRLGQSMLATHGWHLPFFVASAMSLIASLLVLFWLPETLHPENRIQESRARNRGHALREALKRPGMPRVLLISFLTMTGFAMMESTYALLCDKRFNFGRKEVGLLFAYIGILITIYQGGLVRLVARRVPERIALLAGLSMMAFALFLIPHAPWMWPFLLIMIPLAWGHGMSSTATSAIASHLTPVDEQGALFGAITAISTVGRIVGPVLCSLAFARSGYAAPYLMATLILVAAVALAIGMMQEPAPHGHANSL